jgi:4-hydroxybutyrate CoA-transferase
MKRLDNWVSLLAGFRDGCTLVLHTGCAEPRILARELAEHAAHLRHAKVLTMMPMGEAPYGAENPAAILDVATFFPGKGLRAAMNANRVRPLRYSLSEIPKLFDSGVMKVDVLMLQVSSPDESGQVSLGVSVDYMRAVLRQNPIVIAEINPSMPRTCGDTQLALSDIHWYVDATDSLQEVLPMPVDAVDAKIAKNVAGLIRDGAVLQLGIGSLPDCVLGQLGHLQHLGLHTGIVTDPIRALMESGVIDNSTKKQFAGIGVTTMAAGTHAFYRFLNQNSSIEFQPCSLTHDAEVLAGINNLCAINSALQIDLHGNVNAESVDGRRISLPGGLPDFAAGARRARGGMSIIALRSSYRKDSISNIVSSFSESTAVTVESNNVDFVVTEFGVAALRGLSAYQRAKALVAVAGPEHRYALSSTN